MSKNVVTFKNKAKSGNNICDKRIYGIGTKEFPKMSQRALADKLQLLGVDVNKNAIHRIEAGLRFVTDIELKAIAAVLDVSYQDLLD